jgi:hypothetical protein
MKTILTILVFIILVDSVSFAQVRRTRPTPRGDERQWLIDRDAVQVQPGEYAEVFRAIERGFNENNAAAISQYFSHHVFISLPNGQSGYYSGNQSYYILQNYLSGRRIQSLTLQQYGGSDTAPYASGKGRAEARGSVENIQVYVSLSKIGDRWMVTQFTIY